MIKKDVNKFWISREELLKAFGFDEEKMELLMDIKVYKDPRQPLGHQVQGIDLFVEQPTEVKVPDKNNKKG